ncbi:MAG: hypothetical protein KC731_20210 [Myxococcales bacterium]|nr:hypothetical protein [Myxococcales bacterium]
MTAPAKLRPAVLRRELRRMARTFADEVVALLEEHGVWDEPQELGEDEPPRQRRTSDALEAIMDAIVADLRARRGPVSIGQVAQALETTSRQITHPMSLLVEQGKVERQGARRGARYELKRKRRAAPKSKPKSTGRTRKS